MNFIFDKQFKPFFELQKVSSNYTIVTIVIAITSKQMSWIKSDCLLVTYFNGFDELVNIMRAPVCFWLIADY